VALITLVLGLCRSCRGQPTFGEAPIGGLLSSSPGSGSLRWNRQPAAGAAGPSDGAGLLVLRSWRLLGHHPAYCLALGMPYKSSPQKLTTPPRKAKAGRRRQDSSNDRFAESGLAPTRSTEAKDGHDASHVQAPPASEQESSPRKDLRQKGGHMPPRCRSKGKRRFIKLLLSG
jgi:hypothetical protein